MFTCNRKAKAGAILACLLVLLSVLCVSASAANSAAVDLVIVLDNSNSMNNEEPHSDPKGYRYHAAAAMLNLCETESSRAAIIYFAGFSEVQAIGRNAVEMPVPIGLRNADGSDNVTGQYNRAYYTTQLAERNPAETSGNTYLGKALLKAVQLLDEGAATRGDNQPVILVLADGENHPDDKANLEAAVRDAAAKGYKIYPVLLKNKENTEIDETAIATFTWMAQQTGTQPLGTLDNPSDLPEIFSQIFAAQIGSTLVNAEPVLQSDGSYLMDINIPNLSVLEVNILMSLEGVSNVRLLNPDNSLQHGVTPIEIGKNKQGEALFKMYKIVHPDDVGVWKLAFNAEPSALSAIKINVLYSYNLDLQGGVQVVGGGANYKNSQYTVSAQFEEDQTPSTDINLYTKGIKATVYLVKAGEKVTETTPFVVLGSGKNRFEKTVTLQDFGVNESGEYELVFHAEGDGLYKDAPRVPLTVQNRAPVVIAAAVPAAIPLEIDDPSRQSLAQPGTYALDLKRFITDPDGDPLEMEISLDDPGLIALKDVDDKKHTAALETTGNAGTTQLQITAVDSEGAQLAAPVVIPISVVSILDAIKADYALELAMVEDPVEGDCYEINDTVAFYASIIDNAASGAADGIDAYQPTVEAVLVKGDSKTEDDVVLPLFPAKTDARKWNGELALTGNLGDYPIRATLYVGANRYPVAIAELGVKTINYPPVAVQPLVENTVYIEPVQLLQWLYQQPVSEPYTVALDVLFTDQNRFDSHTYSVEPDGQDVCLAEHTADASELSLTQFLKHGAQNFLVTVTDSGGLTAAMTYKLTVISYQQQAWDTFRKYGPIVAAILLALAILRWLWLPSFRNMEISGFRDGKNYLAAISLKPTKRKIRLGLYADPTMLKDVGLGKEQIMSIRLKPRRHSLYVLRNQKPLNNAIVSVEDRGKTVNFRKSKKKYNLRDGGEIKIVNNGHTISWRLSIRRAAVRPAQQMENKPRRAPRMPGRK